MDTPLTKRTRSRVIAATVLTTTLLAFALSVTGVPAFAAPSTGGSTKPDIVPSAWACDGTSCWCESTADSAELRDLYPECGDWDFVAEIGTMYCDLPDYYFPEEGGAPPPGDSLTTTRPDLAGQVLTPEGSGPDRGAATGPDSTPDEGDGPDDPDEPETPETPTEPPSGPSEPTLPGSVDPDDVLGPEDLPGGVDRGPGNGGSSGEDDGRSPLDPGGFDF